MRKMLWIGLTGGIGTGKSTVANYLRELGYTVIDADQIAAQVVAPGSSGLKSVLSQFGSKFGTMHSGLDRKSIADLVFSNPSELEKLEKIIHPLVQAEVQKLKLLSLNKKEAIVFYDVPLLFEKKLNQQFDGVIVVFCSEEEQMQRLIKKRNWTMQESQARIQQQVPLSEKVKLADYVIDNSGTLPELKSQVLAVVKKIKSIAKSPTQSS